MAITEIINNTLKNIQNYIFEPEDEAVEMHADRWMLSVDHMIEALCAQEPNYEQ